MTPRVSETRVRSVSVLQHGSALGFFVALALLMTWPYVRQIQTSLYNWSDALLATWTLAWNAHQLLIDPLQLYQANIFYPYPNTLAYWESLLPQSALALPIILATHNPVLAHNLLLLASLALAAFGAYLFILDLTRSRFAGLVGGTIYAFSSYTWMHLPHLNLLSTEWMPFALLYLMRLAPLGVRPQTHPWRNAFLFAIFFSLQALSSFYIAYFIAVAAALYLAFWFALHLVQRQRQPILASLKPLALAGVLIALTTIPAALPYFQVQHEFGQAREVSVVEYYAASIGTYFSVPDGNWLYARWLAPRERVTGSGERAFVGLIALALAGVGVLASVQNARARNFMILLGLVALILSFGARNEILIAARWPKLSLPFYLPFRFLFEHVPGMRGMRGPDRFEILVVLALAVLAGFGAAQFGKWTSARGSSAAMVMPALLGLIILENITVPVRLTNPATLARPLPDEVQFLAQTEPDAIVLEIPMVYEKQALAWPEYYSVFHWRKLVNGFSAFYPPGFDALVERTRDFPSDVSFALLNEIGVRYVVVHKDLLTRAEQERIKGPLAAFAGRIVQARSSPQADVYQVVDRERGWGAELAQAIPEGAHVWLQNSREERSEFFEIAATFLRGRELGGDPKAAFRPLDTVSAPDWIVVNADEQPPAGFNRKVWSNAWLAVYAR